MRKSVKLLCSALAVCMMVSVFSMSAAAIQVKDSDGFSKNSAEAITPRAVTPTTKITLNRNSTTQIIPWSVYYGYGYWKIFISNYSTNDVIKITITKGSPTGQQVGKTLVAAAGQRLPFYCDAGNPLETGAYYLNVSTSGVHNLNGRVYYKFASSYAELL